MRCDSDSFNFYIILLLKFQQTVLNNVLTVIIGVAIIKHEKKTANQKCSGTLLATCTHKISNTNKSQLCKN